MNEAGASGKGAETAFPDAWVINLARTPERLAAFYKQNAGSGIAFRRFEAADGRAIDDAEAVRLGLIKPGTKWNTRGTIGVALSHRNLWEATAAENRPRIVLEDDAYIRGDCRTVFTALTAGLAGWDVILLGYNTDALVEFNVTGDFDMSGLFTVKHPTPAQLEKFTRARSPVALFPLRHAFGICGYAVSPAGARKLIERCFPMDNRMLEFKAANQRFRALSIDSMMNAFYRELAAYIFVGPLVLPHNDWQASTITRIKHR